MFEDWKPEIKKKIKLKKKTQQCFRHIYASGVIFHQMIEYLCEHVGVSVVERLCLFYRGAVRILSEPNDIAKHSCN